MNDLLKNYDTQISKPEGFVEVDMRGRMLSDYISDEGLTFNDSPIAYESINNDAVILYPYIFSEKIRNFIKASNVIERELRSINNNPTLDVMPLLDIISNADMSQYSNADTVVIYEFNFIKPFLNEYPRCVGIYLRKYGHPALLFKIAIKSEDDVMKDMYIKNILKTIIYGNDSNPDLIQLENQYSAIHDIMFPSTPRINTGAITENVDKALNSVWNKGGREAYRKINKN
ncbi:MAG: hypothetical protein J1F10_04895 [Muribaculaceae bacterium]|nr:hypothetical protein [Muribaculaceae bacterium]